jgi:hypothetical protein
MMQWFIRLPRYGRPLAALNRNGIDIHRRPRRRGLIEGGIALAELVESILESAGLLEPPARPLRLPVMVRHPKPLMPSELPHIPAGTPLLSTD